MIPRALTAHLSSLISQLLILLLLIFSPSNPLTIPSSSSTPVDYQESLFTLLQQFLSTSDIAAYISFSKKRKRAHFQDPDDDPGSRICRLGLFDSFVCRNPDSFRQFFKMEISSFEWLCGLLEPLLECRDPVESPLGLPAGTRLGIGLFRLATGADYPEISSRFRVSEADAKFCVKHLCRVLCTNFRFWVGFPTHSELTSVSARFETLTGIPNCCGIISCTRYTLERTNGFDSVIENAPQQENIAAQIVVDSSSRILNIIAGFRGNKSDAQILNSSTLCKDIEKGVIFNSKPTKVNDLEIPQYFVGNGEYDLLPWLMLPFVDPERGSIEENFNNAHSLMRVSLLKAVASLRSWGVLSRPIKGDYKIGVACIGACSILHNMLIARDDFSAFPDEFDDKELNDCNKVSSGGNLIDEKAADIRNALATSAYRMNRDGYEQVS